LKVIELNEIREGQFVEDLNAAIREAVALAHSSHDKVGIVVQLVIEPRQIGPQDAKVDGVDLSDSIVVKKPKPAPGTTTFFVDGDEAGPVLTRKNPKNRDLPLAPVRNLRD
jgi:hypothetical protein